MKLHRKHPRFFIFRHRTAIEQVHPPEIEGYLGMPAIVLPVFREKKNGTSVNTRSTSIYSAFHSPPPIRPMVEKSRMVKYQKEKTKSAI